MNSSSSSSCALEFGVILEDFCAIELPITVSKARSVVVDEESERIFVLERGTQSIIHVLDSDGDGIPDTKEVVASASGLNHGLAIFDGHIYASSDSAVFRWPLADNFPLQTLPQEIVTNINEDGMGGAPLGHTTRTIVFEESTGSMYVSVGSNRNIDPDSYRSRIRRFGDLRDTAESSSLFPVDFQNMHVFADGLRNEVGMAFDAHGILWGVENSADNLKRADLGGDIHEDNPSEELNRFDPKDTEPKHYGYPYCWTEFSLASPPGKGRGTQWVWPSFHVDVGGSLTDEDCQQYEAPTMALQGHSAPLGITFYRWTDPEERSETCSGVTSFPKSMDGYAFIAYHGSWNRDVPTGYKVVYVEMDGDGNPMGDQPIDLLAHAPPNAKWEDGFRPVDVGFDVCGRLLVTSDGTKGVGAKLVRIDYGGNAMEAPSVTSSGIQIQSTTR
eukprot:CAMPEP_0116133830 /NCGR_PEP_ID=MMETSP0329-20121206/10320_1 /TAXON_ID=697910 /ORGANISM="Pseudo-nitzschia arenysensis, Strain B593" /LENGTH=443 /DNA_ID=CAMNT_0003628497 /DNA_START=65 /DNA_END=1396 /DNA_ORIENTATION=-